MLYSRCLSLNYLFRKSNRIINISRNSFPSPVTGLAFYLVRKYAAGPKRFYRETGILSSGSQYNILLDENVLKTPAGNVIAVPSEALALAVSAEWDAQKEEIQSSSMHLTALCVNAIDNPNDYYAENIINKLVQYLETDTILFHSFDDEELYKLQNTEWQPMIEWFNEEFKGSLRATKGLTVPIVDSNTKVGIYNYLNSFNYLSLHGILYATEALKSVIITLCCVKKYITVEEAVKLSRLEEEYQAGNWGRVEWAHDLNQTDLQSRVSAAMLFVTLTDRAEAVTHKIKRKLGQASRPNVKLKNDLEKNQE